MVYRLIRPWIFEEDPEKAHERGVRMLDIAGMYPWFKILSTFTRVGGLERTLFGIRFPNPVGLAAGFDKNARCAFGVEALGFGFTEVGTIVPLPQEGNAKPRLFRLEEDHAVINRYGFNSLGAAEAFYNLSGVVPRLRIPLGINVGKNKNTKDEDAWRDYCRCIEFLYPVGDYFVANVSSPNTPGLRDLQRREPLSSLIKAIKSKMRERAGSSKMKPLLVKISPDLTPAEREDIAAVVTECEVDGIIDGNTTLKRPDNLASVHRGETGGLSGLPLKERAA